MSDQDKSWLPTLHDVAGPKYRAIAAALAEAVADGRLRPGDRLPPHRDLARRLGVDLTTVTRAYGEARRMGLVEAGGRRGSFVRAGPAPGIEPRDAEPPAVDLTMNMPPQPAGLAPRLAAGYAALLAAPGAGLRLAYQASIGAAPDRAAGAVLLAGRIPGTTTGEVAVAAGGQSALAAVLPLLAAAGDLVAAAPVAYPGFLALARRAGVGVVPVAADAGGLDPDAFAAACRRQPIRALYVVPTNDNPTTATLDEPRRRALAAVAARHGVAILEDDAYGLLARAAPPPIAAFAAERTWHVASVSKALTPALRVAFVRCPTAADAHRLGEGLHAGCVMAPPLNAALVARLLGDGGFAALVAAVRQEAAGRQRLAAEILGDGRFAAHPDGYHLWLPLPGGVDPVGLAAAVARAGLPVVAAEAFAVDAAARPPAAVRVSLGGPMSRDRLRDGLVALAARLDAGRPGSALV